jgi:tRNA (guanine37-N1)-methyltransferase
MRFDVITLFPELFTPFLTVGINRRAFETKDGTNNSVPLVDVHLWNPRDFAQGTYRRIDDRPFGGGPGMVMMAEPLRLCLEAIQKERLQSQIEAQNDVQNPKKPAPVVLFSPIGQKLDHANVETWSKSDGAVLVCGRYEGIDQRFIDAYVDIQISLGDFVLSGGEIAAMALLDAVARLQPGVLGDADSHHLDSFNPALNGLLDCPHYTRPEIWEDQGALKAVPGVLLSGHHVNIEQWRQEQRFKLTTELRPDLLKKPL